MRKISVFLVLLFLFVFPCRAFSFIYEVKKGDTLWDISKKFLGSPCYWYFIWEINKDKIKNPHWIFPGQEFVIPSKKVVEKEVKPPKEILKVKKPLYSWESQIFLTYVTMHLPVKLGEVVSDIYDKDKTLLSKGDKVSFKMLNNDIHVGRLYFVCRVYGKFKDPLDGRFLGYKVRNVGIIKVREIRHGYGLAEVMKSVASLMKGDWIVPFEIPEPIYERRFAKVKFKARVVEIAEDKVSADFLDTVIINVGRDVGLKPGDVIFAYQEPWRVRVASLVVLKTEDRTSTCLVGKVARYLIVGDTVADISYMKENPKKR